MSNLGTWLMVAALGLILGCGSNEAVTGGPSLSGVDATGAVDGVVADGGPTADVGDSDSSAADGGPTDVAATDVGTEDAIIPDTGAADATVADTMKPDTITPDTITPDTITPDTTVADATAADTMKPDTTPGDAGCQSSAACDDGDACSQDSCDLKKGVCQHSPIAGCGVTTAIPCDSEHPCKAGVCDPSSSACLGCLKDGDCAKGSVCQANTCSKKQACQSDVACKSVSGVCEKTQEACVDCLTGDDCTSGQACVAHQCVKQIKCTTSKQCTAVCDTKAGVCVACLTTADCSKGSWCGPNHTCDAPLCSVDACSGSLRFPCRADGSGYDTSVVCPAKGVCSEGMCSAGKCAITPKNGPCSDGEPCTANDTCAGGSCKPGKAKVCDDGNLCTDDACTKGKGCVFVANSTPCPDDSKCTEKEVCKSGSCSVSNVVCDDNNPCTDDSCDVNQGCVFKANTKPCDDGSACTAVDTCAAGKCAGKGDGCDDGFNCTVGTCKNKTCQQTAKANCCPTGLFSENFDTPGTTKSWYVYAFNSTKVTWRFLDKAGHSKSASGALYMGRSDQSDYDLLGKYPKTYANTPYMKIPGAGKPTLHFWLWMDVETDPKFDLFRLEARVKGGSSTFGIVKQDLKKGAKMKAWHELDIPLDAYLNKEVQFRFFFDAVDNEKNGGKGIYIDNLELVVNGCP